MLPNDPIILLSYVNTQLRDNYSSLQALADGLDLDEAALSEVTDKLAAAGFKYNPEANQFK
jgi:biotin operon repressor